MNSLASRLGLGVCLSFLAFASVHADEVLYSNGSVPLSDNAYGISGPLAVSNSFILSNGATINLINGIGLLVEDDYTPITFTWSLGTSAFGSDITSGTSTPIVTKLGTDGDGDNIFSATILTGNVPLAAGTYWFTLSQAYSDNPNFNEVYWIVTNGSSLAFQQNGSNPPDAVDSQAFTINGVPEPSTYALLALTAGLLFFAFRRRSARI